MSICLSVCLYLSVCLSVCVCLSVSVCLCGLCVSACVYARVWSVRAYCEGDSGILVAGGWNINGEEKVGLVVVHAGVGDNIRVKSALQEALVVHVHQTNKLVAVRALASAICEIAGVNLVRDVCAALVCWDGVGCSREKRVAHGRVVVRLQGQSGIVVAARSHK